jgi:hypothetical protein
LDHWRSVLNLPELNPARSSKWTWIPKRRR